MSSDTINLCLEPFSIKGRRFMRNLCPLGRMNCIGVYRRNVLTLKQTMAWVLLWCVSGIVDICLQAVFIFFKEQWTSETIFWIWNIKGAASNEIFHILIPFALSVPTVEEGSGNSSGVDFYVQKPAHLVPRRPYEKALSKPPKKIFVQQNAGQPGPPREEICLKESYKDNVLPRKELPLIDTQKEEIILSIPNLRQKSAFPCILYCKVHKSHRIVS